MRQRQGNLSFVIMRMMHSWILFLVIATRIQGCDGGWVDPETPVEYHSTEALTTSDSRAYELVFSDEFEQEGRTFNDGFDPRWTAVNKNDYTNEALHFYSADNVRTINGVLNITTEKKVNWYKAYDEKTKRFYADAKHVQSGMVQGWNKFCLTGGVIEYSAKLPGDPSTGGLWPALWLLGNLARATFVGSSDFMWPYSFTKCDEKTRKSQEINACSKINHYGMVPGRGRGAPEIDVLEAMQGDSSKLPNTNVRRPYVSCSLQIAPGIKSNRPQLGQLPHEKHWYSHLEYGNASGAELNPFFYGVTLVHDPKSYTYQSDALSANVHLNSSHYQSQHIYRIEWDPPEEDGTGGYIKWFVDGVFTYAVFGDSLTITGAEIPSEPMYLIMNTAVASSWGFPEPCPDYCECDCFDCENPDCACALPVGYCDNFPAFFEIDYIRVWQAVNETKHQRGCSTKDRPTARFIEGHKERYMVEGDKRPLEAVPKGGAPCSHNADCGRESQGKCEEGKCVCSALYTGPSCMAPNGHYDNPQTENDNDFELRRMFVPPSLIVAVSVVAIGFLLAVLGNMRHERKEAKYHKLRNGADHPTNRGGYGAIPFQNDGNADYALPSKSNDLTFCVIDERLMDKK